MNKLLAKPCFAVGLLLQLFFVFVPSVSLAYLRLPGPKYRDPTTFTREVVCTLAAWMFYILMILVVMFLIIAAYKYLTSAGSPEKVKSATNTILYAVVGLVVAILAKSVPLIVINFFPGSDLNESLFCQ